MANFAGALMRKIGPVFLEQRSDLAHQRTGEIRHAFAVGVLDRAEQPDRKRMANFAGALMRKIGPLFKEHRLGRAQLRAAFPEKSDRKSTRLNSSHSSISY